MYKILQLTINEANVLDEIIRIYKLPLEICEGDPDGDYIVDLETDINYNLYEGVYEIIEAINCDNRELFKKELTPGEQDTFLDICNDLGIDNNRKRIEALERAAGRIELQLPGEKYKLVAEINETMPNHQEIDITIEDINGVVVQDIVRVEPTVSEMDMDNTEHKKDVVTAYLYEDKYDEDYTKKIDIEIYDIE